MKDDRCSVLIDKNTTLDFQTFALNSLAIRLRSGDLHYLILGNKVPEIQGYHFCKNTLIFERMTSSII